MHHSKSVEEVLKELQTSDNGLSSEEAKKRLSQYGYNELKKTKKDSVVKIFLRQFMDFLTYLLLAATLISAFLGEYLDAAVMLSIAILSAILGFIQDYRANKAMEALESLTAPNAKAMRDGKETKIPARELVIGDILLIESGDIVPADCRIIQSSNLKIDEASLTGESTPAKKDSKEVSKDAQITEQHCMAFMSTPVTYGKGKCVVVSVGMKTEIGKIAQSIESTEEPIAPLQIKFKQMAKQIGLGVIVIILIVFTVSLIQQDKSIPISNAFAELVVFSLSLAVAAIPNSLPAIVTISLAMGAKILATKKMIVKRLPATESLGEVTVICTDKTGTITKNEMTAKRLYFNNKLIDISGAGYYPEGSFSHGGNEINPKEVELLLRIGYLCNTAKLCQAEGKCSIIGDPTEGSLVVLGKKAKLDTHFENKFRLIEELPFDSERKRMAVVMDNLNNKKREAYVKGAPDILLEKCDKIYDGGKIRKITASDKKKILKQNHEFGIEALRVLAFAYKEIGKEIKEGYKTDSVEENLVFAGLVGMIDPPRDEVRDSISKCREAGIRVMVITGDHADTARAVVEDIGLWDKKSIVLTGSELDKLSDSELQEKIENITIIARAMPLQKIRVVDALQKKGHVVAMTGDGVNDAPALKKADVGVAMGITGTDVAKEVSNAILVDDNFATIVNAVSEGRNIYDKIIKSTRYLLSCNVGEVVSVFVCIMASLPLPLIPLQILMMNLVTDGLPALAIATEPGDKDIMQRPPRNPKDRPLNNQMLFLIAIFGIVMGIGTFLIYRHYFISTGDLKYSRTIAFTSLVMLEMFAVFGSRSFNIFGRSNPFSNKWINLSVLSSIALHLMIVYWRPMQAIFETVPLTLRDWGAIIALAAFGYLLFELSKTFIKAKITAKPNITNEHG